MTYLLTWGETMIKTGFMATLLVAMSIGQAPAQSSASPSVTSDLDRYRLSMADARKYVRANQNLTRLEKTHAGLQRLTQPDSGLVMSSSRGTYVNLSELDRTERNIARNPQLSKAVQDAGLTPRQYVLANWVVFFDGITRMMGSADADAKKIFKQARIHPENILFLKQHRAELEAFSTAGQ